jgi:hypothetical protein
MEFSHADCSTWPEGCYVDRLPIGIELLAIGAFILACAVWQAIKAFRGRMK